MQKRGEVQKGFFITVLLIIGALVAASYFQSGQTGQSIYQFRENREIARQELYNEGEIIGRSAPLQGPSKSELEYPTEISCPGKEYCYGSVISIFAKSDKFSKREEAEADAIKKCDSVKSQQISNVDKCIGDLTISCLKKECKPTPNLANHESPCTIKWCQNTKPNPGTNTHTVCVYVEKRTIASSCAIFEGSVSEDIWVCLASDGTYSGSVKCEELQPTSTSSTSVSSSSSK